ncbi:MULTISPECIES: hypothetical protein [unclassified Embleya]|uniref:hypothetical protein n=1 Tax=unclassified Embleya TaxID=2699296 RepID=UPI0034069BED
MSDTIRPDVDAPPATRDSRLTVTVYRVDPHGTRLIRGSRVHHGTPPSMLAFPEEPRCRCSATCHYPHPDDAAPPDPPDPSEP